MARPVVTQQWSARNRRTEYKVAIAGTSKFLLFTEETLGDLLSQIEALKGPDVQPST